MAIFFSCRWNWLNPISDVSYDNENGNLLSLSLSFPSLYVTCKGYVFVCQLGGGGGGANSRYILYRDYPRSLLFSVGIFWLSSERLSRRTLHIKEGEGRGVCTLVLCSLATVTSCINPSVRIVTKFPKVEPLLTVYSPSLWPISTAPILITYYSSMLFRNVPTCYNIWSCYAGIVGHCCQPVRQAYYTNERVP